WEWVVSYYAIHKLGAVANPINVMLTPDEVAYVANDCGAKVILASADKGDALASVRERCPIEHIIVFSDVVPNGVIRFADVLSSGESSFLVAIVAPESLCTIGYTSGTTGRPKGAMLSHRAVLTSTAMTATLHMRTADDVGVSALPCSHVYGNVVLNGAMWYGMKLVLIQKFSEHEVFEAIRHHKATIFDGVPTMYMYLLAHPDRQQYDTSSLQRCTVGGQTMPVAKIQQCEAEFGCPLLELWGMTELAGVATTHPLYGQNRHGSIGLAIPGIECRIADTDDPTRSLPPEEVGEILVRGSIVMLGYYGNDEATKEAIGADGWLRTGDLGRMDKDGYFYVVDRKKDLIITGGFNVYPAELERVVAAHPAVAMVAVGSQQDEVKGEVAKAYIVLKPGMTATAEDVLSFCREHLAAYKMPRSIQFVDHLPKTSTGKLMRRMLKTLD
ncbi:MAG TPA: AMP-binding protein, partial [Burkholderiaceae bacterium]|nr:AMP-binding protein [Burkholderiaceae bacterium]